MTADDPRAWLVRPAPAYEGVVFWENLLVVGWGEIPDLSLLASKDELRALHREYYGAGPDAEAVDALHAFVRELKQGDVALVPLASRPGVVAAARVAGGYVYRQDPPFGEDVHHARDVVWLAHGVPVDALDADLRAALDGLAVVAELHMPHAVDRILALAS